ncbi:hypothetical protein [Spirosoma oryzicola]|uniref:hypothetical protein n=1 Tax=Spirosoma oryzicola TaxID=2898794 RepID=UPI001E46DFA5|nr:hypothetical protein [Spirosoma oryzicola]UHG93286.1 hypothetical protein LQ777_10375 [Spirosoma oryzicola]
MNIPANILTIVLLVLLVGVSVWGVQNCSGKQDAAKAASELRYEKKLDSLLLLNRALSSEKDVSALKEQNAKAAEQAQRDEHNRADRDNQTALMVAMMNRPSQDIMALRGLIENGFLSRERYADTSSVVRKDSGFTAAVAVQGKVLSDTREEVQKMGIALRQTQQQMSGLEEILNKQDKGISNAQLYIQDRIDERGLFRAKSKKQFKEANRMLNDIRRYRP